MKFPFNEVYNVYVFLLEYFHHLQKFMKTDKKSTLQVIQKKNVSFQSSQIYNITTTKQPLHTTLMYTLI